MKLTDTIFVVLVSVVHVNADYDCICNQHSERDVYKQAGNQSTVINNLYEGDCVPLVPMTSLPDNWVAVAINNEVAYMLMDYKVTNETCPGASGPLPTPLPPGSQTTTAGLLKTTTTQTTTSTTTTTQPSTTATHGNQTASCYPQPGRTSSAYLSHGSSCYEFISTHKNWLQAEIECKSQGGFLVTINNQEEQDIVFKFTTLFLHQDVWIGLNDRQYEGRFQWVSGISSSYSHFGIIVSHVFSDCIIMGLQDGKWFERDCSANHFPYVCEYDRHNNPGVNLVG